MLTAGESPGWVKKKQWSLLRFPSKRFSCLGEFFFNLFVIFSLLFGWTFILSLSDFNNFHRYQKKRFCRTSSSSFCYHSTLISIILCWLFSHWSSNNVATWCIWCFPGVRKIVYLCEKNEICWCFIWNFCCKLLDWVRNFLRYLTTQK